MLALLLSEILVVGTLAQSYSIDWFTIAGGGGSSTGSVYSITGTIGQLNASTLMTRGNFLLTGGFWSLYAVQTKGAPMLSISRTNNAVMISWPSTSTNWILKQNTNLNNTNWITAPEPITDNGTLTIIFANPHAGNRFYRLFYLN